MQIELSVLLQDFELIKGKFILGGPDLISGALKVGKKLQQGSPDGRKG